jgi:hypothetical protein
VAAVLRLPAKALRRDTELFATSFRSVIAKLYF